MHYVLRLGLVILLRNFVIRVTGIYMLSPKESDTKFILTDIYQSSG